jgi:hypothetical protein
MSDDLTSKRDAYHEAVLEADAEYMRLRKEDDFAAAEAAFDKIILGPRAIYDKAIKAAYPDKGDSAGGGGGGGGGGAWNSGSSGSGGTGGNGSAGLVIVEVIAWSGW